MMELFARDPSPYQQQASEEGFVRLVRLIARCIAPEPSLRPIDIAEVLDELQATQRAYPWDEFRAQEWWSENEGPLLEFAQRKRLARSERADS